MLKFSNEKSMHDDFEDMKTHKILPTVNFLDHLTISSYGRLRKVLLTFAWNHIFGLKVDGGSIKCHSEILGPKYDKCGIYRQIFVFEI